MICLLVGHSLEVISVTDGTHYGITALRCKFCRKSWDFNGEDQGWSKSGKEKHTVHPKGWVPYFGLRREKRYKSLTAKQLAPVYIRYALELNRVSNEQAIELRKMPPEELVKLFSGR